MARPSPKAHDEGGLGHSRPAPVTARLLLPAFAVFYATICLAFVAQPPVIVCLAERVSATRWLASLFLTLVGPGLLFIWGIGAWWLVVGMIVTIAGCLALSRFTSKRSPASGASVVWLLLAAGLWAVSGWLAMGLGI